MLKPSFTKQFDRDIKRMLKRGKEIEKIKSLISKLINEERLESKYYDHKLISNYEGRRECHIEPDWLLIYKLEKEKIIFERTGTHSDLF
jgi:mRNA interferase YafQ